MRKRKGKTIAVLTIAIAAVILAGCDRNNDATALNTEGVAKSVDTQTVVGEKTDIADEMGNTDSSTENKEKYDALLEKYGYANTAGYLPRKGEVYGFYFTDVVESIEDIQGDKEGMISVIHFSNEVHDVLVEDSSRQDAEVESVDSELLSMVAEELHQPTAHRVLEKLPEVGTELFFDKDSIIAEVIDTGISFEGSRFYVIDNGFGLLNLLEIKQEYIPDADFSLYEFGTLENDIYSNPLYNFKIQVSYPQTWERWGNWMNTDTGKRINRFCESYNIGHISLETYEFVDALTDTEVESLMQQEYAGMVKGGMEEITGKTYQSAEYLTEDMKSYLDESKLWYRYEDNKIFVLSIQINPYIEGGSCEEVLKSISPCVE